MDATRKGAPAIDHFNVRPVAVITQPPVFACGTLFQSSCVIPTSPTDCSDDS